MAYRQYTQCCSIADHVGGVAAQAIVAAAAAASTTLIFGAGLGPAALIAALTAIIAYCRWWLYDRLICLGGDKCAIGWVLTVEPPDEKSGFDAIDTDYSINLVLPGHTVGATQHDVANDGGLGILVKETSDVDAANLGFTGNLVQQWANDPETACLHAEFEGGGVYDLLMAALAAMGVAVAAAIVCVIPVVGWIACLLMCLISAGVALVGLGVALSDQGNPNDVNSNLGEIHTNDPTGRGADILVVQGTWVYDSAHSGWNELHPIKHCQRIGTWEGYWDGVASADEWCSAISDAQNPTTVANQGRPENMWNTHPDIDGCEEPPQAPK